MTPSEEVNHLTYPVVAPVGVCIVITAENYEQFLREKLFSLSSVKFGTEIELGILEKPAETISLVGREICVCQYVFFGCFSGCFD